jgi:hypothetical protein
MLPTVKTAYGVRIFPRRQTPDAKRQLSRLLLLFVALASLFLAPSAKAAGVTCATVGSKLGIQATCMDTCGSNTMNLTSVFQGQNGIDAGALCPATQICCVNTGPVMCEGFANTFNLQGQCRSLCNGATETEFPFAGQSLCGSTNLCCVVGKASITTQNVVDRVTAGAKPTSNTAQATSQPQVLPDPLGGVNIPTLIGNIVRTFTGIAGSLALLMFVYGGIRYILSGGEQAAVQSSKKILFNASIGIVLIFLAYLLTSTIINAMLAT